MKPPDSAPVQVNFSLYPADVAALTAVLAGLKRKGVALRRGALLRALVEITSATDMFAAAMLQHIDYEQKRGPREEAYQTNFAAVDMPPRLIKKLEDVLEVLAAKEVVANRSSIVRAIVRAAPKPEALAPLIRQYLVDFPRRERSDKGRKKS